MVDYILASSPISIPALLSQFHAAKNTVTGLQSENKNLKSQLQSLRLHLAIHQFRIRSVYDTKEETKRKLEVSRNEIRHVNIMRDHLFSIHSNSVSGTRAVEYKVAYTEYVHLQDKFRGTMADYMLVQYLLQKLIIDTAREQERHRSQLVRRLVYIVTTPFR